MMGQQITGLLTSILILFCFLSTFVIFCLRAEFSKWWLNEFKTVRFPPNGNVFDFYVDSQQQEMIPWVDRVPKFELDPDLPLQAVLVHTAGREIYLQTNSLFQNTYF